MSTADRDYDNTEKHARIDNNNMLMQVHRSDKEGLNYSLSEGLTTWGTMNYKYGYLEMRAKIPFRHGAWPSFWEQSCTIFQTTPWMSEIDIFEVFSSKKTLCSALHKWGYGTHCSVGGVSYSFENFENLNDEYHVYGLEWDEKELNFYVDDIKFGTIPIDPVNGNFGYEKIDGTSGFHDFHFVIMNNEIFSPASKFQPEGAVLTDEDEMPIDYYIDWIRLYQNPEKEEIKFKADIDAAIAAKEAAEAAKQQ
jgi:beta-glucanase (GH16 family)